MRTLLARAFALVLVLVLVLEPHLTSPARAEPPDPDRPRNVILFIGDGMGPTQVTLGRIVKGAPLFLDSIADTGMVLTTSLDAVVCDSAAGATALASGEKTNNKMLGVRPDGTPIRLITEDLAAAGYAIGIATNTRVTHATPGGFYAHVKNREEEKEIAKQLLASKVTVCIGGGGKYFPADVQGAGAGPVEVRCFTPDHMPPAIDREAERSPVSLELMTRKLLEVDLERLRPGAPFFVMIEGGRIDHAGHGHDAPACAREVLDFDDAVRAGVEWARKDGRTLVLVTADHATGGLAISEKTDVEGIRRVRASAYRMLELGKPGGAAGLREVVRREAGIELTEAEAAQALAHDYKYARGGSLAHLLSARLGVHFAFPLDVQDGHHATEGHDATMVPLYAVGPGAARFRGTLDNTDIPNRLRELLGVGSRARQLFAPISKSGNQEIRK